MNILNKKYGFTLMEMMIVVVILGFLSVAGIPYYKKHIERQKAALGITNLRAIADSAERYMAMHNDAPPTNFDMIDAELDSSKLSAGHTSYNDGNFTFNFNGGTVIGQRNTGDYTLTYSLANSAISCTPSDYCLNTLNLSPSDL